MIYFDYCANTPVDAAVLDRFYDTERTYIGNPNSNHSAGRAAKDALTQITDSIAASTPPAQVKRTIWGLKESRVPPVITAGTSFPHHWSMLQ